MSAPDAVAAAGPLEVVLRSPALVKRHDKDAWLALFTEDAVIEDPVGAGAYVGPARHSKFWDAFIAPNEVTFHARRDFRSGDVIVRYVTISSVTPVSREPFELSALIEYVVRGERLASLRAFWEPRLAVSWHARQGVRGLLGLSKHGLRMTGGLGLGSAMGFSRALVPQLSRDHGRALAEKLARAMGGARADWLELTRGARVGRGDRARPEDERRGVDRRRRSPGLRAVVAGSRGGDPGARRGRAHRRAPPRRIDFVEVARNARDVPPIRARTHIRREECEPS